MALRRDPSTDHLDGYIPFWMGRNFAERVVDRPKNTEQDRCSEIRHNVEYTLKMAVTRVILAYFNILTGLYVYKSKFSSSNIQDCSKHFTLYFLVDLFN